MENSRLKICSKLLNAGYGCVSCYDEYVTYRKDNYVVTVMCDPETNNQVTNLYLDTVRLERILTTDDDSVYDYYNKVPLETFLKIVLGTTSKIPMRIQNAINERILEDL